MARVHFKNANLFQGFRDPQSGSTVVVDGSQILFAGRTECPDVLEGDRVIDLSGMTLMPGLTVGHFHADYPKVKLSELSTIFLGLERPPAFHAAVAVENLRNATQSGFTSVVGAGCAHDIDVSLKMAIAEGIFPGPRITAAGRHINTTGGDNDRAKWWYGMRPESVDGVTKVGAEIFADGEDALTRAVRSEIANGVEIIKILPTGGHGLAPVPAYRGMNERELAAIVEAARDRGARVRAHVVGSEAILQCIKAGVAIIDHGDGMDDACIDAMVKAGTILVPSLSFLKVLMDFPKGSLPEAILMPVQQDFEEMAKILPRAHEAGVKIVPGDDYGLDILPHIPGIYARDLVTHVEHVGISARDVLGWATVHGAAMTQRSDLGSIAAGMTADLVIVNGDPTENIGLLTEPGRNIPAIMIDGVFLKDELTIASEKSEDSGPILSRELSALGE